MSVFTSLAILHRASHQAFPVGRNGSVTKRLKFILRSWPRRQVNTVWFGLLQSDPFMRKLAAHDHRVYRKLYRPYLSTSWNPARTLDALQTHYAWLRRQLPGPLLEAVFLTDTFRLATWTANRTYQLRLPHDTRFYQEGEFTLSLLCPELGEGELALLSATIARAPDGVVTFHIGGLQGADRRLGAPAVKEAGRDLHGLRPKSLLVIAGQMLAGHLGCARILATSAATHAYSTDERRHAKERQKMFFDYDTFWEECEGVRADPAFFELPMTASRRSREAMKPQKRPMYHRRYAMLDELEAAIVSALTLTNQ